MFGSLVVLVHQSTNNNSISHNFSILSNFLRRIHLPELYQSQYESYWWRDFIPHWQEDCWGRRVINMSQIVQIHWADTTLPSLVFSVVTSSSVGKCLDVIVTTVTSSVLSNHVNRPQAGWEHRKISRTFRWSLGFWTWFRLTRCRVHAHLHRRH